MTATWNTSLVGMNFTRQTPPDESTVELTWRIQAVENNAEISWNPITYWLSLATEVPETGRVLTGWLPNTSSGDWTDYFRCRRSTWRYLDDSMSIWEATATFTSKEAWCPHPWVWRTDQTQTRQVEVYRQLNPTAAMLASTASSHTLGTTNMIDTAGKPVSRELGQVQTNVSFIWNTSIVTQGNGYPNIGNIASDDWLDSRNDTAFLGYPVGTVRLSGVTIEPDRDEYVRVTYEFLYDPWGHMVQEAETIEGAVKLDDIGIASALQANPVYWKNSIAYLKDYNELLSAAEADWLIDGWRTYDSTTCTHAQNAITYTGKPNEAQVGSASAIREYPVAVP